MRLKWPLLALVAVLGGVGAAALSVHWRSRAASVRQAVAAAAPASSQVTLSGQLRPQNILPIKPEIDGNVDAFMVDVGDDVFEDEVLARVGSAGADAARADAAAAVSAAEAEIARQESSVTAARLESAHQQTAMGQARDALEKARAVYERQQTLNNAGATPRLTWEKAQRDYQSAQKEYASVEQAARLSADQLQEALKTENAAEHDLLERRQQLEAAQTSLQSAEVHAPVAGIVVARNGGVGKPAGDDLFEIATDMNALEVLLDADPAVLPKLHPGQPALVLILDLQSDGIPGQVTEIQGSQVLVQFNCNQPAVRPGMRVDVRLKLQ